MLPVALESARHSSALSPRSRFWLYVTASCYVTLILLAPKLTSGNDDDRPARHHIDNKWAASKSVPEFRAAIALGNQLYVLHHLAPAADAGEHEIEVLPLVHGQALLRTPVGEALHPAYTLALEARTCTTEARRRVRLELDSGEPEAPSALGPAWIADELNGCHRAVEGRAPLVAVVGRERIGITSSAAVLPQRVIQRPGEGTSVPCGLGADEFLDARLELGQATFAVWRSFLDLDRLRIVSLDEPRRIALDARASLFWDDEIVGC